jgi:hypothetical protein
MNANMTAIRERLGSGRIAFYGAFKVPPEMKEHYDIV